MALYARLWQGVLVLAGAVLVAANLFLFGYQYCSVSGGAFNSDHLLVSGVCDDIVSGRSLSGWHWPGAPYVFPDMVLMLPCRWLLHHLVAEFLAYDALIFLAVLAAAAAVGRAAGLGRRQAWSAAATGLLLLLAAHLGPDYRDRLFQVGSPGSHLGVLPVGLLLLALAATAVRRGWRPAGAALFVACGGLAAFSDKLLAVQFLAPLAAALLVLAACRVIGPRSLACHLGLIAAAVLLSFVLRWLVPYTGIRLQVIETFFRPPRGRYFGVLLGRLRAVLSGQSLLQALIPLQLLAAVAVVRAYAGRGGGGAPKEGEQGPHRGPTRLVGLVLLLLPLCNLGALAVTGMTDGAERYALPVYMLPLLTLGVLLRLLPGRPALAGFGVVVAAAVVLAGYRAATRLPAVEPSVLEPPYSPMAQALDRLAEQRGIRCGLAGFWNARHLTLQSHAGVGVHPITPTGSPLLHAANALQFLASDPAELRTPRHQFIIVAPGQSERHPTPGITELQFGTPDERLAVGEQEIWIYDRMHSTPLDRFLRAQLADRLIRTRPYHGPVEPACLAQPKAAMTPLKAPGVLALPDDDAVEVHFARPVHARTLAIAAAGSNQFDLDLFAADRRVGRLHVPAVPWPKACYGDPGLQSRLVDVPPGLREQAWDRVQLRPRRRTGPGYLGHVLVFEEDAVDTGVGPSQQPVRLRLEAEDLDTDVTTEDGHPIVHPDATASGNAVRQAPAGFTKFVTRTPYVTLPPGKYRLDWAVRVDDNPATEALAFAGVFAHDTEKVLAARALSGWDFAAVGRFTTQRVTFELAEETDCLQFALISSGRTGLAVDYVELVALPQGPSPTD
jgi:hypothetical protein